MKRIGFLLASAALCGVLVLSGPARAEDRGGWHGETPCCGGWGQAYAGLAFSAAHPWWGLGYPYYGYSYAYPYGPYGYDVAAAPSLPLIAAEAATAPLVTGRSVATGVGGSCSTPVTACALRHPSYIGGACSCRVAGGRVGGTVAP
jgi:hypothetical protein